MENATEYTQRLIRGGARAHKSMGQVFLMSDEVIEGIVLASTIQPDVPLVEIGPGLGVLTRVLAQRVQTMWAVELDKHKIGILTKELRGQPIEIVNQDALTLDLNELWGDQKGYLVGNLPYYITSPLIMHFLEQADRLSGMTIMVQKEVADRIAASPGSKTYGILSIAVQISLQKYLELRARNASGPTATFENAEAGDGHTFALLDSANDGVDQVLNSFGGVTTVNIQLLCENFDQLCFVHSNPPRQWSALDRLRHTVNPQHAYIHEPRAFTAKSSENFFRSVATVEAL